MAKKANTPSPIANAMPTTQASFTSLKDMAYQHGGVHEVAQSMAQYALEKIPGFPDAIGDEALKELTEGYRMRYDQRYPAKVYAVIGDHYVTPTDEQLANESVERVAIGVAYAFSYSQQEFGKLKNTKPELHGIVKRIRDATSTYCSNRIKDLQKSARELIGGNKGRKRGANADFAEFVKKFFDDVGPTRLKSAKAREDSTADAEKWSAARAAFLGKWNA